VPITCAFAFNHPYVFEVSTLLPAASYMMKASYSATTPARFAFEFSDVPAPTGVAGDGGGGPYASPGLRRILNTAIAHFESATSPTGAG
jgi:hypothetical protein